MKLKKILFVAMVLTTILAAGCASAATPTAAPAEPTSAPVEPTSAPVVTEAPATMAPATEAPTAPAKLKFAMVTDQAGLGDQGFNDLAWAGLQQAQTDFNADINVLESREQSQYVPNFVSLAENKTDLIVGVGFLLSDAITEAATEYPDAHFAIVDSTIDLPNVASLVFKENEGSFLVGAIAGMMTQTGTVGFVGGVESDLLKKFEAGYKAGVETTNPDAKVLVSYVGSFADPAKGKEMANAQYDQNADVVYEVGGLSGTGVIEAAKDRNLMAISVDRDKNYLAPENVISGMIKRVDNAVYLAAKMVAEGNFEGGVYSYGVKEGGIDIAPTTEQMVPANVYQVAQDLKQMIIDGEVNPPATLDDLASFTPPAVNWPQN